MERHLIDYVRRPELMDAQAVADLTERVSEYPYFHAARILLLKALYQRHDAHFDVELRRGAALLPSRESLFQVIERKNLIPSLEQTRLRRTEESVDPTQQLLDDFLKRLPVEHPRQHPRVAADATTDYIGYLMAQQGGEEILLGEEKEGTVPMDVIDKFLDKGNAKIQLQEREEDSYEKPDIEPENNAGNDIFTETLAQIYIKQGNFQRAIEIIRRLSLKYPKKNRYFADQIRFLEKIIINNKNK